MRSSAVHRCRSSTKTERGTGGAQRPGLVDRPQHLAHETRSATRSGLGQTAPVPTPEQPVVLAHIEPDRDDLRVLQRYRAGERHHRRLWWPDAYVVPAIVGVWGAALVENGRWASVGLLVVLTVTMLAARGWQLRREWELELQTHRCDIEASEIGLAIRRTGPTEIISWDVLADIIVTETHLLARWSPRREVMVPRRCVAEPADWDRLCGWATRSTNNTVEIAGANPRRWNRNNGVTQ